GRLTIYTYDATGEHLLSVTDPAGTTTYSYASGLGAAREHALLSITSPVGSHVFYSYDALGRLIRQERDGGAEAVTISYPGDGEIVEPDTTGAASSLRYNDAGQLQMEIDPLGHVQRSTYDVQNRLVEQSAGGLAYRYRYDGLGNLRVSTDPLG